MSEGVVEAAAEEEKVAAAQASLREAVTDLEALRGRLAALRASIPPSPEEIADEDLPEVLDVLPEIRAVTGIVIRDHLDPLIGSLTAAAEYRPPLRS